MIEMPSVGTPPSSAVARKFAELRRRRSAERASSSPASREEALAQIESLFRRTRTSRSCS